MRIKLLEKKEYSKVKLYLNKYWRKNHIFTRNKKLFDWMYFNKKLGKYNFLIGVFKNNIIATKGYQPLNHFDPILDNSGCFMSMWSSNVPTVGIKLFNKLYENKKFDFIGGVGSNENSVKYQEFLNFKVGKMNHAYKISTNIKKYKIVKIKNYKSNFKKIIYGKEYININLNFLKRNNLKYLFKNQIPEKSSTYLINRYLKHPIYKYQIVGSKINNRIIGLLVLRECYYKDRIGVRIVDYVGKSSDLKYFDNFFDTILNNKNIEYIDFYSHGIPKKDLYNSGLILRKANDKNIIPNFYEPFKRINYDIVYGYSYKKKYLHKIKLYKGDSDMDRPNL